MSIVATPNQNSNARRARKRRTSAEAEIMRAEAYGRAIGGKPNANYVAIIQGFMAKGLAMEDIEPRVNVFTYNAWKHLGRQVRRGEHSVRVITFVPIEDKTDPKTGEVRRKGASRPRSATVFHVSQTDEIGGASCN